MNNRIAINTSVTLFLLSSFVISGFASAATFKGNDVNLVGSANITADGDLQLTSTSGGVGAAWDTSAFDTTQSFYSEFSFRLSNSTADGFAFVLQNIGTSALGAEGGGLGVSGLNPSVSASFQTWVNNNVGITVDGNVFEPRQSVPIGNSRDFFGSAVLRYDAITHELNLHGNIYTDNTTAGTVYTIDDSRTINLFDKFGNEVYVGFTGATGGATANQYITGWQHNFVAAVPEPETYALMIAGLGLVGAFARRRKETKA